MRAPRRLAGVVLVGVIYYVIAVVFLALLHPDMSPIARPISGYQKGPHPLLAATTFFALATTIAALALALGATLRPSRLRRLGLPLFWIAAAGIVIAGVFPSMPVHAVGALMAFPSLCVGTVLLSLAPGRAPEGGRWRVPLLLLALAACGIFLAGVTVLTDLGLAGLAQRVYVAVLFGWMTVVGLRILTDPSLDSRE